MDLVTRWKTWLRVDYTLERVFIRRSYVKEGGRVVQSKSRVLLWHTLESVFHQRFFLRGGMALRHGDNVDGGPLPAGARSDCEKALPNILGRLRTDLNGHCCSPIHPMVYIPRMMSLASIPPNTFLSNTTFTTKIPIIRRNNTCLVLLIWINSCAMLVYWRTSIATQLVIIASPWRTRDD